MAKPREPRFKPHVLAAHFKAAGLMASDGVTLFDWCGTHWAPIDDRDSERKVYRWIVENDPEHASAESARKGHNAIVLWLDPLPPPTKKWVIPTLSGYLHLGSGAPELLPADPNLGLTHVIKCRFEPSCPVPELFMALMQRILPDPATRDRVQEFIGYTLLPDARYQRAQFWIGDGANGKGAAANVFQALHGKVGAISLDDLSGFQMSGLIGASLIYADEIPRRPIDEQRIKSAIAGETMLIDRKYREPLSIRLSGKWLVLGNHLPAVTDHSSGFWRRWDVVPFSAVIPEAERNPTLAQDIIENELTGVLLWALQGLARLLARGGFDVTLPAAMRDALLAAKVDTNSVVAWIADAGIRLSGTCTAPKDAVFDAYREWCGKNALREVASPQFWRRMKEHFRVIEETRPRDSDGRQPRLVNVDIGGAETTAEVLGPLELPL